MSGPSDAHVEAARRVLALASADGTGARSSGAPAGRVYDALFEALAPVIGAAGARALFARSVKLTAGEFPCVGEIADAANSPEPSVNVALHLVSCLSKLDSAEALRVATGLYSALFSLMAKFIGEQLVWQIVRKAFPAFDATAPEEAK